MKRFPSVPVLALGACLNLLAAAAVAQQRFPPPEFDPGYRQPVTAYPPTQPAWGDFADLGVMLALLVAATFAALVFRRRGLVLALSLVGLLYLGFYRGGCVCPIGAIQQVAAGLFVKDFALPLAAVGFFLLPLIVALVAGRSFCGAVCPLGAAQDVLAVRPIRVPIWLEHSLGLLAYVYLGAAILFVITGCGFFICQYDPFVSLFRMVPLGKMIETAARGDHSVNLPALSGRIDTLLLASAFVAIGMFIARPYCRYLCPYGVLLGWLSKLSFARVTITPGECVKCRLCEGSCPFNAMHVPSAKAPSGRRLRGRSALVGALVLLPLLTAGMGALGGLLGPTMARAHWTVRLADRVKAEDEGKVKGATEASEAFRAGEKTTETLFAEAGEVESEFTSRWALPVVGRRAGLAHLLGAFVGAVIGLKLVGLTIRRKVTDYEPDRASCLSCGRCFAYCPIEHARRKGVPVLIAEGKVK
jgi:polyferredoxin